MLGLHRIQGKTTSEQTYPMQMYADAIRVSVFGYSHICSRRGNQDSSKSAVQESPERRAQVTCTPFRTRLSRSMSLLEASSSTLPRLTAICPPSLIALLHAGTEIDVHSRRHGETERFRDLLQVQTVDVEDAAKRVRGVGLEIGAVAVFCGLRDMLANVMSATRVDA